MISRGRRRYVIRSVRDALWKSLTPDEREAEINRLVEVSIDAIAVIYQIPRNMLMGQPK